MKKVCLDTGLFSIYFGQESPEKSKVTKIIKGSLSGEYEIHVLKAVLAEVFYHLCVVNGTAYARSRIKSLTSIYPIVQFSLNEDLIARTGQLKCQNRTNLSYIDCMSISYCLLNNIPFYTTEKKIKQISLPILDKLRVSKFRFNK